MTQSDHDLAFILGLKDAVQQLASEVVWTPEERAKLDAFKQAKLDNYKVHTYNNKARKEATIRYKQKYRYKPKLTGWYEYWYDGKLVQHTDYDSRIDAKQFFQKLAPIEGKQVDLIRYKNKWGIYRKDNPTGDWVKE